MDGGYSRPPPPPAFSGRSGSSQGTDLPSPLEKQGTRRTRCRSKTSQIRQGWLAGWMGGWKAPRGFQPLLLSLSDLGNRNVVTRGGHPPLLNHLHNLGRRKGPTHPCSMWVKSPKGSNRPMPSMMCVCMPSTIAPPRMTDGRGGSIKVSTFGLVIVPSIYDLLGESLLPGLFTDGVQPRKSGGVGLGPG